MKPPPTPMIAARIPTIAHKVKGTKTEWVTWECGKCI